MTRKQKRLAVIFGGLAFLGIATGLVLVALNQKIVFFVTPSDLTSMHAEAGQRMRLGGIVKDGSVVRGDGTRVRFAVTDTIKDVPVTYDGILPDLFREGQGVVTEGLFNRDGVFVADTVLAKHDENYMPKEVVESLKEKGVWQEGQATN
ncbi:cytochrome c maturation protein CcmE [Zhengella mangrovi]|uniref:Cytochrome c-type biogenesis protein CcmE n=1 Tax=Zhengella mangrovi TaxID=1982044 RepID=A0A2G1QSJ0_9HYPH|nr:cytochrome c maturation protein CcmE [Zhengella mangrovi]PHP68430.1 cytochrome c maturation protein CcmE [Zhengella mangrovi]